MRHALVWIVFTSACVTPMEVEELEKQVADLESRVAALEGRSSAVAAGAPSWVARGSVDTGGRFFGVGSVKGIANHALARVTADNRARAEIARLIESTATAAFGSDVQRLRSHVNSMLTRVRIVDHWVAPDGTVYSLAEVSASP